jgi:threonine dehydratase
MARPSLGSGIGRSRCCARLVPRDVHIAPENRICVTIQEMLNHEGIVLEPAGALAVDVLARDRGTRSRGKTVVCVTSGGNFDFERLPEVKERAQNWQGLKKYFILRLPQRPGALRDFLDLLGRTTTSRGSNTSRKTAETSARS